MCHFRASRPVGAPLLHGLGEHAFTCPVAGGWAMGSFSAKHGAGRGSRHPGLEGAGWAGRCRGAWRLPAAAESRGHGRHVAHGDVWGRNPTASCLWCQHNCQTHSTRCCGEASCPRTPAHAWRARPVLPGRGAGPPRCASGGPGPGGCECETKVAGPGSQELPRQRAAPGLDAVGVEGASASSSGPTRPGPHGAAAGTGPGSSFVFSGFVGGSVPGAQTQPLLGSLCFRSL